MCLLEVFLDQVEEYVAYVYSYMLGEVRLNQIAFLWRFLCVGFVVGVVGL